MLIMMIIVLGCVAISQTSTNSIAALPATSVSSSTIAKRTLDYLSLLYLPTLWMS